MNIKPLASNMTELELDNRTILFSYKTPVAALINENGNWHQYKTDKFWSRTTSRHINKWLAGFGYPGAQYKPQEFFDNLVSEVK